MKLINGDCLEEMDKLIEQGIKVDTIITDPPYRTTSRGSSGGTGGILKEKINMSGKVFKHNDVKFSEWLPKCYEILKENSHAYFMTNNKNLKQMLIETEKAGFKIFKTLIWVKNTSITNMFYMDTHEYIIFCRKGKANRINNCGTKSVLNIDNPKNKLHPTEKPIELMKILIENSTKKNDIVLDPFMGSGSTGVGCVNTGRDFIGIEIDTEKTKGKNKDQSYFDIAKERIEKATKEKETTFFI
jgi:site-specific DNA-methyltransferase (adenine-specific)